MKYKHTSQAFLMEMLWVCGFFILSACIFILAFMKADDISLKAQNLNHAVTAVQNAVEDTFYDHETGRRVSDSRVMYFDKNGNAVSDEKEAVFSIFVESAVEDGLLKVSAHATDTDGTDIYSLDGSRYLPD